MEEGIVPGGTESLLYSLIFPNNACAETAKANSDKPLNMLRSGELMEKMQAASTVAQIKNESKAKQLAKLEAATLCSKKRKLGDPEEQSSERDGDAGAGALTKKQVPFARYRACTESTRKELELKKHADQCQPVKKLTPGAGAVECALRWKLETPSSQVNWRGARVRQGQPVDTYSQKTSHHEAYNEMGVGGKGQDGGHSQQAETLDKSRGKTQMSKSVVKAKTSVSHEQAVSLWPMSKKEEELVYRLNVDSPRYFTKLSQ